VHKIEIGENRESTTMPAKGYLNKSQKENLQKALSESDDPKLTQRILMLLLMNDGKTYQEISDWLGCSYRSVAYWCVHGDPDKLETLLDGRSQGNYRKATEEYIKLLMETVEKEPTELGYEFGRWTTARLSTYMEEKTGIKLSKEQIRRILEQKKYAYLWAKYTLEDKQNQDKRNAFKEKLDGYLEATKASPELIILDNASYHKKKTILADIEKNLPNIQLYFLPEYSPDYNLVELVWHSAKEYISHRLFKSVDELKNLLDKLLNQGELIIKWGRKIKNKGNAAIAS
jgi:transposase